MLRFAVAIALCGLALICQTTAQRLSNLQLPFDHPGISDECSDALNATVSCPSFLLRIAIENPRLAGDSLTSLCTSECESTLNSVRSSAAQSCTTVNDSIPFDNDRAYGLVSATYILDQLLHTYALSCRKDQASGKFCDDLYFEWGSQNLTAEHACSYCTLGQVQTLLNSSFVYDEDTASDFSSMTSSCGASGYSWTIPTPQSYPPRPTVATHWGPMFTLTTPTHVKAVIGDGWMFSRAPGTFSDCLQYANGDVQQETGFSSNRCSYVADSWKVTVKNLTTWNPSLNESNCEFQPDLNYCVRLTNETHASETPNFGYIDGPLCDTPRGNLFNGTNDSCVCFWNVYEYDNEYDKDTDFCEDLADWVEIEMSDLLAWNSWLDPSNCTFSIFADLDDDEQRPVCLGLNATSTKPVPSTANGTSVGSF